MNPTDPVSTPVPLDLVHFLYWGAILAASLLLGFLFQRLVLRRIHRLAKSTTNVWDNVLVDSMKGVAILWFFLIGLAVVLKLVPLRPEVLVLVRRAIGILGIVSAVIFFSRLARQVIYVYIVRIVDVPTALFKNSATVVIYLLGFLVILDYVGVSITPLVTALGVSGVGFALALQDTLTNLFAGLSILMTRKVRPGDYVQLDTGQEGIVTDIAWRNTTIRSPESNMVVAQFTESISFDRRLWQQDIAGSIAHATMLQRAGLLTPRELRAIVNGLKCIARDIERGQFKWRPELEDVHMNLEAALTRRVPAIETLGSATELCVDKTGTLSENRMEVVEVCARGAHHDTAAGALPATLVAVVRHAALACGRAPFDPMERAIVAFATAADARVAELRDGWRLVREYDITRELLAVTHCWQRAGEAEVLVASKGGKKVPE